MNKQKQLYRLPIEPREVTDDPVVWTNAWNELANKVVKYFPGYHVGGMDPGISLYPDNHGETVSLSLHACRALLGAVKRQECEADHAEWHQRWGWDANCSR